MRSLVFFCLVASLASTGCASMFARGPDVVQVSSEPPGAKVELDRVPVGTAPCQVSIARGGEGMFTFDLEGYERETVDVDKILNWPTLLNLFWFPFGTVLGFGIDLATGHIGKYPEDPIHVRLRKK